jgi:hypothetical protein
MSPARRTSPPARRRRRRRGFAALAAKVSARSRRLGYSRRRAAYIGRATAAKVAREKERGR